jgi:hypothetical protein
MLTAAVTNVSTLSSGTALVAAAVLAGAALLAGVTVVLGRKLFIGKAAQRQDGTAGQPAPPEADFMRSWIAITLVIGLEGYAKPRCLWSSDSCSECPKSGDTPH